MIGVLCIRDSCSRRGSFRGSKRPDNRHLFLLGLLPQFYIYARSSPRMVRKFIYSHFTKHIFFLNDAHRSDNHKDINALVILKHTRGQTAKQKQDCRAIYPAHHSCSKVRMPKTKLVQQKLNKSIAHRVMFTFHRILWYCAGNMNVHQISTFSTPAQQKVKLCSFQTLRMRKCTGHLLASCIYVWY